MLFGSPIEIVTSQDSFIIQFHLGVKMLSDGWFDFLGIMREKKGVDPDSVTYEGLIADVKSFGFHFKRMWYEFVNIQREIEGDANVNEMFMWAWRVRGRRYSSGDLGIIIVLYVEGGVDSEWEGEYDEEMMKMLREERRMKTDVYSNEDGAKGDVSCPNEDSSSASVGGESETHGNSFVDDSELGRGNAECFEATTSIAEEDLDYVKKQVELHGKPKDKETITLEHYGEEIFLNTLNKGKRQRDDDHAQPRHNKELNLDLNLWSPYQVESIGATQGKRQKEDDQARPNHSLELKLELNSGPTPQVESTSATQGKRQREDDHAHPQINEELNLWPTDWRSSASYKDRNTSGKNTIIS